MPAYMKQKLSEIETHSKRLYDHEDFTGLGLDQEYAWIRQAVDVLRNQIEMICEKAGLVDEVKKVLDEGGDSKHMIARIKALVGNQQFEIILRYKCITPTAFGRFFYPRRPLENKKPGLYRGYEIKNKSCYKKLATLKKRNPLI